MYYRLGFMNSKEKWRQNCRLGLRIEVRIWCSRLKSLLSRYDLTVSVRPRLLHHGTEAGQGLHKQVTGLSLTVATRTCRGINEDASLSPCCMAHLTLVLVAMDVFWRYGATGPLGQ